LVITLIIQKINQKIENPVKFKYLRGHVIIVKSRKSKRVVLKHPALRSVRSVLREVLYLTVEAEKDRLYELERLYIYKRGELTPSQRKREISLAKMRSALDYVLEKSTCVCCSASRCHFYMEMYLKTIIVGPDDVVPFSGLTVLRHSYRSLGNPFDIDMVWNPVEKAWYCEECFNEYIIPDYIENEGRLIDYIPPPMDETEWHIVDNQVLPLHEHPKRPDVHDYIKYYFVDRNRRWEDYIKDNPLW